MSWNYESIKNTKTKEVLEKYADATKEEILARLIEVETALYPYYVALSPITEKSWRGTTCSSKLFPLRDEDSSNGNLFYTFNPETRKSDLISLTESQYADAEYYIEDGLSIDDGTKLGDKFEIVAFHQQAPGAYVGNGSVSVGDVRHTIEVMRPKNAE